MKTVLKRLFAVSLAMCVILVCAFAPIITVAFILHITGMSTFQSVLLSGPSLVMIVINTVGFIMYALEQASKVEELQNKATV